MRIKLGPVEVEVSREGQVALVLGAGVALSFAGAALGIPFVLVVGLILFGAGMLTSWIMRPTCEGETNWHKTEDGEIAIGTCNSCDRWYIYIRSEPVAFGRGFAQFQRAMEQAIQTNQSYLPHLSAQLRKVLDGLEKPAPSEAEEDREESEGLESLLP